MNDVDNKSHEIEFIEDKIIEDENNIETMILLSSGAEMAVEDLYDISSVESSKLIILAGSTGCGKTTLITSIYHQFLNSTLEKYSFAGSKTLQAFEKRAFYNRIQSNQSKPEMKRTQRGTLDSVLHLRLHDNTSNQKKNLFLSDFSGEDYEAVIGDIDAAREEFSAIYYAQTFVLILDGFNIASKICRNRELQKAIQLIRTFNDSNVLHANTKIIIVLSKYDKVFEKMKEDLGLQQYIESIITKIESSVPELNSSLSIIYVAAMPSKSGMIPQGYGVEDLINILYLDQEVNIRDDESYRTTTISQFNLFGEREKKEYE